MRLAEALAAFPILCIAASPAAAAEIRFDVPGGRLSDALIALAEQAHITIALADPGLAALRAPPLRGQMSVQAALARLLAGTGYRFQFVGPGAVRILRAPQPPARPPAPHRPAPSPAAPLPLPPEIAAPDIIVTASKLGTALDRFPGTAHILDFRDPATGRFGISGSDAVLERLPILASTSLGPGRDKIYIRGVADSSFNGPSQSIVGQYLGDARLTFNAPDPDLELYDMAGVEVLEGPQGTLYGSGALGGIVRLIPNPPNLTEAAGNLSTGLSTTRHGAASADGAAMLNLPLATGRLALRAVAYGSIAGGWIDDVARGLGDVNRIRTTGGRAALLWAPGGGWQVEAGGLVQYQSGRDGQYAMRGLPSLTRSSTLAQPFDNDYELAQITVRKAWHGVELVSATGLVRHSLESRFDATGFPRTTGPQLYVEQIGITLLTHETRLSQPDARGAGWIVGWSLVEDIERSRRTLGPPDAPEPISGVRNEIGEAALFGQYSVRLGNRVTATLGGRLTVTRSDGSVLDVPPRTTETIRTDFHPAPSAALAWRPRDGLLFYARLEQGYRAGGLAVTGVRGRALRFVSDHLTSLEAGFRLGRSGDPFELSAAVSAARWKDMQADLITARGLPFTTNLGDGRILGAEADASWRPARWLSLDAAAFLNASTLFRPAAAFAAAQDRDLPNVPEAGGRAAAHVRTQLSPRLGLAIDAAVRYVGRSTLGIGAPLDVRQGGYVDGQIGGRLDFGRFGLSLDVDNLGDVRGNRFSFGNPFSVASGLQTTPLRPRTVRLGFDAAF